jgi:hypothetical protein
MYILISCPLSLGTDAVMQKYSKKKYQPFNSARLLEFGGIINRVVFKWLYASVFSEF